MLPYVGAVVKNESIGRQDFNSLITLDLLDSFCKLRV